MTGRTTSKRGDKAAIDAEFETVEEAPRPKTGGGGQSSGWVAGLMAGLVAGAIAAAAISWFLPRPPIIEATAEFDAALFEQRLTALENTPAPEASGHEPFNSGPITARLGGLETQLNAALTRLEALEAAPPPGAADAPQVDDSRLAALESGLAQLRDNRSTLTTRLGALETRPPERADLSGIEARLDALEAAVAELEAAIPAPRDNGAGVFALAVAVLTDAARGPGPFPGELAAARRLALDNDHIAALAGFASAGAPDAQVLAARFPETAARAALAPETAEPRTGLMGMLSGLITVRRVDAPSTDVEAQIGLIRAALDAGDLASALRQAEALPDAAQGPMEAWLASLQDRLEIDRHLAALRADAAARAAEERP